MVQACGMKGGKLWQRAQSHWFTVKTAKSGHCRLAMTHWEDLLLRVVFDIGLQVADGPDPDAESLEILWHLVYRIDGFCACLVEAA